MRIETLDDMCIPRVRWSLLFSGLLLGILFLGPVAVVQAQDVQVRNVQAYQQGNNVVIEYDLNGDQRVTYDVDLRLSRDGGNTFDYAPSATSGAVGSGVSPGTGKEIVWAVLQDFPDGLEGENYQFKVLAEQEGTIPTQEPTAQRQQDRATTTMDDGDDEDDSDVVTIRLGGGLSYNTRETIQVQFYDGYQLSALIKPASASLALRASYRIRTGTFRQTRTLDFDLLYEASFFYLGPSIGVFDFDGSAFEYESNQYNLSSVVGIGFSLGPFYPYVEYRYPFARGLRDDVLGGGIMVSF